MTQSLIFSLTHAFTLSLIRVSVHFIKDSCTHFKDSCTNFKDSCTHFKYSCTYSEFRALNRVVVYSLTD